MAGLFTKYLLIFMDNLSKVIVWLIGALIVLGGGWFLYQSKVVPYRIPAETGPITIGFIGPLTGDVSSLGGPVKTAVELAVEEINQGGGINGRQVNVIYEDGQCSPTAASNAGNKLINADKVAAIIGGLCSTETAAFASAAMQSKVIMISPASSAPNLSQTGKYFFRDYPSDAYQGKVAAEYAYNTLGARKVAIVYHVSDWGTGIKDVFTKQFTELGGQIVAEENAQQTDRDYRTQLAKVKVSGADYIYAPAYPEGATVLLKQSKEMGITTKFLGGDVWGDTKFQKDVSGLADILFVEPKAAESAIFAAKFLAKSGEKVTPGVPNAYDAVYVLKTAIEKAGGVNDRDALADAIRSTNYDGASGHIEFDQNGDVTVANYIVKRIANGTATEVK